MIPLTVSLLLALAGVLPDTIPTAAIVAFEALGATSQDAEILTERFRTEVATRNAFRLVERARMDEILREQGFQQSGCTSTECAVQTGRLLGVRRTIAGSISHLGSTWSVSAREIDVETGEILRTGVVDVQADVDEVLTSGMGRLADRLLGRSEKIVVSPFLDGLRQAFASKPAPVAEPPVPAPVPPPVPPSPERNDSTPVGWTPFQVVLIAAPFPQSRKIHGVALNAGWGRVERLRGIQAGLANQVDSTLLGIQGGLVNFAGDQQGVQGGVVNSSRSLKGIQGGVINMTKDSRGIQGGVINMADECHGVQFGLLNLWKRDGKGRFFPLVGGIF